MKNFLKQTFQPKKEINQKQKISKEKIISKTNLPKKTEPIKNKKEIKPRISQEIMNANLSLLGQHPITQNLKSDENNNKNKDEKLNLKNLKEEKLNKNKKDNNNNNNTKDNNNKNITYKEPYKQLSHYIIDKNLRFEENKSKNKNINLDNKKNNNNNKNNNEDNNNEEQIKNKRKKINLSQNQSKKKNNKFQQEKAKLKKEIDSLINNESKNKEKKEQKSEEKKPNMKKSLSGNFMRLNLNKKYQEKKRFRPVKLRKIALNHSRELYKYQKKTLKNSISNYMGKGNQGLEDLDTLMKEQNDAEKNDNNNLLNTLVDKLPVFSQSFIEETQKTPNKIDEEGNKEINEDKNNKNINMNKTPITNRLTTILKNSLRKKVSLDTELKFLSQEFKYLLSGQKDKINKLNEIKQEVLLSKNNNLEIIKEENNNINNLISPSKEEKIIVEEEEINNELPKEEIEQIEKEILITVLKENFNLDKFNSESQIKCIKSILSQKNTFYISPPGPFQNLVYEYCSLLLEGLTIVISPVLPNITQNITSLSPCLKAAAITSFTTPAQKKEIYSAIKSGILNILYINPERFVLEKIEELKSFNISLICLEEILYSLPESNHFRPLYINIINKIQMLLENNNDDNNINKISILLLSNYITKEDKEKISDMYNINPENIIEEKMGIVPGMNLCISKENNLKLNSLLKLLRSLPNSNANSNLNQKNNKNIFSVIFCNYKKTINEVTTFLNQNGISATSYHGGKDEIERQIIQNNFIKNKIKILVCTSNYSLCFIQNYIKYIIIYDIPFSIEQLLNEFNKKDFIDNNKYVHIFLDDANFLNQRRLIFSDILDRKTILNFIEYIFNDSTKSKNNNINNKKKRNYLESIGEVNAINLSNDNHNVTTDNKINLVNTIKCLNFNSIEEVYDIKKNFAIYFLLSLSNIKDINNNFYNMLDVLGIGPSEITLRFFKTEPKELSNSYPLLKTILSNCKERMGAYTFNVSNICNIAKINNYNEIISFLYKLQELKEISYETKEDGIFIRIKKDIKAENSNLKMLLLNYFNNLNNDLIKRKLEKLNCVYIFLRKFAVTNISVFSNLENDNNDNITNQIKCLVFSGNNTDYQAQINNKIFSYFDLYKNNNSEKKDVIFAGNENEKDILLPIVKFENQRDKINFINGLKNLIKNFLQNDLSINTIDVLFVLIGFFQKGKGIKNYMSHPMWNKYSNYDFEQLFDIVDSELKNIKVEFINENNGVKPIGSKVQKIK